jgi:RNA polymerase sigma-70 factor (ECF subfamily)
VKQTVERDAGALSSLIEHHGAVMLDAAWRLLRHEGEVGAAVLEALQEFAAGAPDREPDLQAALAGAARQAALERLRRASRQREPDLDGLLPRFKTDGHQLEPAEAWPESADALLPPAMLGAVAALPAPLRAVVILCDGEGLSLVAAGELLQIEESLVKTRLHRGRQALRTLLARHLRASGSSAA